jgi:hypothetical protein
MGFTKTENITAPVVDMFHNIMTIDYSVFWLCFCIGLSRVKRQIEKPDIAAALHWFQEQTGSDARFARIHPRLSSLAGEFPKTVDVILNGGTSAWSIDLAATLPVPRKDTNSDYPVVSGHFTGEKGCDNDEDMKIGGDDVVTGNTRAKTAIDDVIKGFVDQGLGCRVIAEQLSLTGIDMSYRTVARHIKKAKVVA